MRSLVFLALFVTAFYMAICALIAWNQNSLLFYPVLYDQESFLSETKNAGLLPWENAKGETIGARTHPIPGNKALLVFHGNGGDAISRSYLRNFIGEGWDLYLLEYPGYGSRPGDPSESALNAAALEGVDLIPNRDLYLFGESLGSGVACLAAAARPARVKGLFLISPYPSLVPVAASHYPWLPVSLLLQCRLDATDALKKYTGPVAVAIGEGDVTIPNRFGRELYEGYSHTKHLWSAPNAGHDTAEILLEDWPEIERWMFEQR